MESRLNRYPVPRHSRKGFRQRLGCCAHLPFQNHISGLIEYAVKARSIAKIQADRQLPIFHSTDSGYFLGLRGDPLHRIPPYHLRIQRADNLGA